MRDWEEPEGMELYRRGLAIRGVVAAAFLLFFLILPVLRPEVRISGVSQLTAVLAFLILVNPILWWIGHLRGFPSRDFYLHWVMDIAAVSAVIHYLGGLDVPIAAAAYMVMIVSSATFATMRASLMLAATASASYAAISYAEQVGMIRHYHVGSSPHVFGDPQIISACGAIVFFFIFAYLAGTLAAQLRGHGEKIASQKVEIEKSLKKEQASREGLIALSTVVQHDVYGPLGVISGACREAERDYESGDMTEARRWLTVIGDRLRSIEGAVSTLGVFSTAEADQVENVEVFEVVDQVIGDLRSEWSESESRVETVGEWPIVVVSRASLYHVLRNLVSNAIRSLRKDGSGVVRVTSGADPRGTGGWVIVISDNGPGLPREVLAQLQALEPERVRLTRQLGGNFGAGLSLAKVLVSGWRGTIEYQDDEKGGSTFSVRIPRERVKDPIRTP